MTIQAAIFDRDGVLTDFDMAAALAYFRPRLPISLDELGRCWNQWSDLVGPPRSVAEEKTFWRGFWDWLSNELSLSQATRRELQKFDYTDLIRPFADARPALLAARRQGLRVGVLSNFGLASLEPSLAAAGLADLVHVAYSAPVIGVAKPDPGAYLRITQALSVDPAECLFFDDEISCVEGARALDISAFLVDRNSSTHQLSQGIVRDLSAVLIILNSRS